MDLPTLVSWLLKGGFALLLVNELRGLILAAPVLYGVYQAGGTLTAIWLGVSSLGGIALSVFAPVFVGRKLKASLARKSQARQHDAVSLSRAA